MINAQRDVILRLNIDIAPVMEELKCSTYAEAFCRAMKSRSLIKPFEKTEPSPWGLALRELGPGKTDEGKAGVN